MQLQRKSAAAPAPGALTASLARGVRSALSTTIDRRTFLKRSGIGVGAGAAAGAFSFGMVEPAQAQAQGDSARKIEVHRTVCTHCSVGCAIDAVVENGVWIRQEPVFDSAEPWRPLREGRRHPRARPRRVSVRRR